MINISKAKSWYGKANVPYVGTKKFAEFAAGMTGFYGSSLFVGRTTDCSLKKEVTYRVDSNAENATINLETLTVTLPGFYFLSEFYQRLGLSHDEERFVALSVINGSIIHELLHLEYTELPLDEAIRRVRANLRIDGLSVSDNVVSYFCGLTEDILIEGFTNVDHVKDFILVKNDVFFSEDDFLDACINIDLEKITWTNILNIAIFFKNERLRESKYWKMNTISLEIGNVFREFVFKYSKKYLKPSAKIEAIVSIIKSLANLVTAEEGLNNDLGKGTGISIKVQDSEDSNEDSEDSSSKGSGRDDRVVNIEVSAQISNAIESSISEIGTEEVLVFRKFEEAINNLSPSEILNNLKSKIVDISDLPKHGWTGWLEDLTRDNFDAFAQTLKRLRSVNNVPGIPTQSGSKILKGKLYKANTENAKIFTRRSKRKAPIRCEVITLADISGSTRTHYKSKYMLIEEIVAATKANFKSLAKASIYTRAFAFTTKPPTQETNNFGREEVNYIVHIASSGSIYKHKKSMSIDERFSSVSKIKNFNNMDGFAIQEMEAQFSKNENTKKILCVISDGLPSAIDYYGRQAINHTKTAIEKLRSRGILIFAFVVGGVKCEEIAKIYGEAYTIDCTSKKRFETEIQKVLLPYLQ